MNIDHTLYKLAVITVRERAKAYFENKNWKQLLINATGITNKEGASFFKSNNPSLKTYCIFISYLDKISGDV